MNFGLSPVGQAIASAVIMIAMLALYLFRFTRSARWLLVAVGVCLVDQYVKHFVLQDFTGRHLTLFGGAVQVVYLRNREQGFGGSVSYLLLMTLICVLMLVLLYDMLTRSGYRMSLLAEFGFALMVGGCMGILLERILLGFVVDFLEFGRAGAFVYNLADLAVFLALGLLVIGGVRYLVSPRNWRGRLLDKVV